MECLKHKTTKKKQIVFKKQLWIQGSELNSIRWSIHRNIFFMIFMTRYFSNEWLLVFGAHISIRTIEWNCSVRFIEWLSIYNRSTVFLFLTTKQKSFKNIRSFISIEYFGRKKKDWEKRVYWWRADRAKTQWKCKSAI